MLFSAIGNKGEANKIKLVRQHKCVLFTSTGYNTSIFYGFYFNM
jgi:hypothetical protein